MATMNFERTQSFKGYGTRTQWVLVAPKAGEEGACEVATSSSATVLGSLFNVNVNDGEPVGVITDKGVKVCGIAKEAITAGDALGPTEKGYVKKAASGGIFVALTSATAEGQYVEMVSI